MFERYTERARRVIFFSRFEASQFGSRTIETEHLLLGMLRESRDLIEQMAEDLSAAKKIIDDITSLLPVREKVAHSVDMQLSPECKRILAYGAEEAGRLNHAHIGSEHLLLGILREENCLAAQVLSRHGLTLSVARARVGEMPTPSREPEQNVSRHLKFEVSGLPSGPPEPQQKNTVRMTLSRMRPAFVDLSHTLEHGMVTYKGLPAPLICDYLSREASRAHYTEGTSFHIGKIEMVANTGTYLDSPFHRYASGKDLSELPLTSLANLPGIIFHAPGDANAIPHDLFGQEDLAGKAVLIHTGWSKHWGTDQYFEDHPFLTRTAAEHLKKAGAALVGIDSYNIDDITDGSRPAHSILLAADIPIVEHMCNLDQLADRPFVFTAVPAKVKAFGTFPVRAFAMTML